MSCSPNREEQEKTLADLARTLYRADRNALLMFDAAYTGDLVQSDASVGEAYDALMAAIEEMENG